MRRFDFHNWLGIVMSITKCYSSLYHSHSHPSIEHTCLDTFFSDPTHQVPTYILFSSPPPPSFSSDTYLLLLHSFLLLSQFSPVPFVTPFTLVTPVTLVTPTTPIIPVTVIRVTPIAHLLHPVTHCYNCYILLYIVTPPLHPVTLLSPPSPLLNL